MDNFKLVGEKMADRKIKNYRDLYDSNGLTPKGIDTLRSLIFTIDYCCVVSISSLSLVSFLVKKAKSKQIDEIMEDLESRYGEDPKVEYMFGGKYE